MSHYHLRCPVTSMEFEDDGVMLANPASPRPALLRAVYERTALRVRYDLPGLFRFMDWLPVNRALPGASCPVTWRSAALGPRLGLERLVITFSGYWPERGAMMTTGTFKECEAYAVCARLPAKPRKALVVASAGNTARAFLKVASEHGIPLVVVVPAGCLGSLWLEQKPAPWVKVVAAGGDSDYFDAIDLADRICRIDGFQSEGGAKNVARRDGMGTTALSAATTVNEIPDYYFQAVGSGTGAIAAHEANLRLNGSGLFTPKTMCLQVSQNTPFLPIYDAWKEGLPATREMDAEEARKNMGLIDAKVLSNRRPPYGIAGGLYEALSETGGDVIAVTNGEARQAGRLFEETEGCDICPEAAVAVASLIKKARSGEIPAHALVMLNITGGGLARIQRELNVRPAAAEAIFTRDEFDGGSLKEFCAETLRQVYD